MAGRDPTRIAETLRGVAAGTTMYRISHGQSRMISAGILSAAADVVETVAAVTAERDRAMQACEQIGAQLVAAREALATVRPEVESYRNELLRDFCTAGTNDRSTMDADEAESVGVWDAALATIDAALGTGDTDAD